MAYAGRVKAPRCSPLVGDVPQHSTLSDCTAYLDRDRESSHRYVMACKDGKSSFTSVRCRQTMPHQPSPCTFASFCGEIPRLQPIGWVATHSIRHSLSGLPIQAIKVVRFMAMQWRARAKTCFNMESYAARISSGPWRLLESVVCRVASHWWVTIRSLRHCLVSLAFRGRYNVHEHRNAWVCL
jgi:hypothetical protein